MSDIPVVHYGNGGPKSNINDLWWTTKKDVHNDVFGIVLRIRNDQVSRKVENARFGRLYTNTEFGKYMEGTIGGAFQRIGFNVAKACVDTACAKISTSKTRPLFLTSKGTRKQQNRAKKLTQYIDGCYFQGNVYEKGRDVFRDGCIFGTGALKILEQDGQVAYERVFIQEIVVDDLDGRLGNPRQLHQTRLVHREVLKQSMKDSGAGSDVLRAIDLADADTKPGHNGVSDLIEVIESWHLPSSPEAKDGRHTICIKKFTLVDDDWKHPFFPFVFFRWNKPVLGFYGLGLIHELLGIQLEINLLLVRIKEAQELMAVPRIFVEEGSQVNTSHINDEIGGILKYRGTAPQAMTWQGMNAEIYNYLEYLFKKAFEITGISQLSASSKKPAGLDSGVALREYQDIETERFATVAESYQQFFLEVARITIAIQREIAENNPGLSVNVKSKKFMETIRWKEVDLDEDKYIMQVFPTSFLPKTPEGKLQFTQELIQSGFIDPEMGLSLLDFPDLESFFNLKTAAIDDIHEIIDQIVEDENYTAPDTYMNLRMAISMGQSAYLRAKTDGTSEVSLELLQRFTDDCQALLQQMNPPAPPPVAPQAVPQAPPRSDLLPSGPQPSPGA